MNLRNKFFPVILCFALFTSQASAITLVYNMKIRRQFNAAASAVLHRDKKSIFIATAVPIIYKRDRHIVDKSLAIDIQEKRLSGGSILNFRYVAPKAWWAEVTTGIEHESVKVRGTSCFKDSRTGLDDIVLSAGYNMFPTENSQFVLYGLAGIPTRRKVTALEVQDTLVGTRFYSIGAGAEFSYSFINSLKESLIAILQARFIHFFSRNWAPVLPIDAQIQPGNVTDLLFTLQYRKKKDIFELGYNPTFFTDQAVILKTGKIEGPNFVRNSMYLSYARVIPEVPVLKTPMLLGAGINIGNSKRFETKILTFWLNISVIF